MGVRGEVQEVRLDPLRPRVAAAVGVDREEEVGALRVGDRRPLLEGDEAVRRARHHDLGSQLLAHEPLHPQGDVEHDVLLLYAAGPDRARIVAAVAGVDHDAPRAEAELAGEAVGAGAVGLRRQRRDRLRAGRPRGGSGRG